MKDDFNFLPEDYKEPSTEKFTTIEDGTNTLRILTPAIYGLEYWTDGDLDEEGEAKNVCHRVPLNTIIHDSELRLNKWGKLDYPKIFWAFAVYNWDKDCVQIFQTSKDKIRDGIRNLMGNPKWGSDLRKYDIVVTKTGKGKDTEYAVTSNPKEDLDQEIWDRFEAKGINLEAIFKGENPFGNEDQEEGTDIEDIEMPQTVMTAEVSDDEMNKAMSKVK